MVLSNKQWQPSNGRIKGAACNNYCHLVVKLQKAAKCWYVPLSFDKKTWQHTVFILLYIYKKKIEEMYYIGCLAFPVMLL